MKLENQVCNLELSKRLKELGFKQESLWWWNATEIPKGTESSQKSFYKIKNLPITPCSKRTVFIWRVVSSPVENGLAISAYTTAELGEIMSGRYHSGKIGKNFGIFDDTDMCQEICEKTEANARALMIIYLVENGLLKP